MTKSTIKIAKEKKMCDNSGMMYRFSIEACSTSTTSLLAKTCYSCRTQHASVCVSGDIAHLFRGVGSVSLVGVGRILVQKPSYKSDLGGIRSTAHGIQKYCGRCVTQETCTTTRVVKPAPSRKKKVVYCGSALN